MEIEEKQAWHTLCGTLLPEGPVINLVGSLGRSWASQRSMWLGCCMQGMTAAEYEQLASKHQAPERGGRPICTHAC